jgi:hypothetical protein
VLLYSSPGTRMAFFLRDSSSFSSVPLMVSRRMCFFFAAHAFMMDAPNTVKAAPRFRGFYSPNSSS